MSIDLDHWMWKEKFDTPDGVRYISPHVDPDEYEYPLNFLFTSREEAEEWLDQWVEDDEDHEPHESEDWVLIHYVGTIEPRSER